MPGSSTTTQNETQQASTSPWTPAQEPLENVLSQLGGMSTSVTPAQSGAYSELLNGISAMPQLTQPVGSAASSLLSPTGTAQSTLTGGNTALQSELSPYLSSSYLNPMTTPGLSTELQGLTNTISNNVNDQFAANGMSGSPANQTALAYGLEQGEAPVLTGQYNANVANQQNAANMAFGGNSQTAAGLGNLSTAGSGIAALTPSLATAQGTAASTAANAQQQQPFTNLSYLTSLLDPISALGSQSTGSMQGTATTQGSLLSSLLGGAFGIGGLLGGTNAAGTGGSGILGLSALLSDERVKDDIEPVGKLYDGQKVYSYTYKGDDTPRIGLIAQEVEKTRPDAVIELGPDRIKAVDYGKATQNARYIGMLADLNLVT